jgi:hypothetical protein
MQNWKRWWGVRHLRYWWIKSKLWEDARALQTIGIGNGVPWINDLFDLELIWRGKR